MFRQKYFWKYEVFFFRIVMNFSIVFIIQFISCVICSFCNYTCSFWPCNYIYMGMQIFYLQSHHSFHFLYLDIRKADRFFSIFFYLLIFIQYFIVIFSYLYDGKYLRSLFQRAQRYTDYIRCIAFCRKLYAPLRK